MTMDILNCHLNQNVPMETISSFYLKYVYQVLLIKSFLEVA